MKAYMVFLFFISFIIGLCEVVSGLGTDIPHIPADIAGGLAMIVISAIFLKGVFSEEAEAYYYVGSVILAAFGVLYILVMLAEIASCILAGEELAVTFRPESVILPFAIPGVLKLKEKVKEEQL